MTEVDYTFDDSMEEHQFTELLNGLLRAAHDADVDLEGSASCRNDPPYPDWDVTITEVRKPPRSRGAE